MTYPRQIVTRTPEHYILSSPHTCSKPLHPAGHPHLGLARRVQHTVPPVFPLRRSGPTAQPEQRVLCRLITCLRMSYFTDQHDGSWGSLLTGAGLMRCPFSCFRTLTLS